MRRPRLSAGASSKFAGRLLPGDRRLGALPPARAARTRRALGLDFLRLRRNGDRLGSGFARLDGFGFGRGGRDGGGLRFRRGLDGLRLMPRQFRLDGPRRRLGFAFRGPRSFSFGVHGLGLEFLAGDIVLGALEAFLGALRLVHARGPETVSTPTAARAPATCAAGALFALGRRSRRRREIAADFGHHSQTPIARAGGPSTAALFDWPTFGAAAAAAPAAAAAIGVFGAFRVARRGLGVAFRFAGFDLVGGALGLGRFGVLLDLGNFLDREILVVGCGAIAGGGAIPDRARRAGRWRVRRARRRGRSIRSDYRRLRR